MWRCVEALGKCLQIRKFSSREGEREREFITSCPAISGLIRYVEDQAACCNDQIRSHYISSSHTRLIRCLTLRRVHLM